MDHAVFISEIVLALAAWTAILCAISRRALLRAVGVAATPWLAIGSAVALCAFALLSRPLPAACTCGAACIALAIAADADARTGYLFDVLTLPSAGVVFSLACLTGTGLTALFGCIVPTALFGAIVLISQGRAMGLGDVKAMASLGAAFGPVESLFAIAAACASGIVEAGLRGGLRHRTEIRFGPHLAIGAAVALVWGESFARFVARTYAWA